MAEVEEELTFCTKTDAVEFKTKTNGDTIFIHTLHLSQAQATSMAWLINANQQAELEFTVKIKET